MQTQTSNTLHNAIMEAGSKDRPPMLAPGIDNDIYSIVDACPNACEMWKAIERLKQDHSKLLPGTEEKQLSTLYNPSMIKNLLWVSNDDHYNVFAIESAHPEQSKSVPDTYSIKQDAHNVIIDSLDMSYDRGEIDQNDDDNDLTNERELPASLIEKLKCKIDESKNHNKFLEASNRVLVEKLKEMKDKLSAHQETISILSQQKEAQIKLYKTHEDKELDKVIALENKVK
nr:hypothetical protein [Tanacetum cinerariifolium]